MKDVRGGGLVSRLCSVVEKKSACCTYWGAAGGGGGGGWAKADNGGGVNFFCDFVRTPFMDGP